MTVTWINYLLSIFAVAQIAFLKLVSSLIVPIISVADYLEKLFSPSSSFEISEFVRTRDIWDWGGTVCLAWGDN